MSRWDNCLDWDFEEDVRLCATCGKQLYDDKDRNVGFCSPECLRIDWNMFWKQWMKQQEKLSPINNVLED